MEYVLSKGYWVLGNTLQDGLTSKKYQSFLGNANPVSGFRHTLSTVPFSIPDGPATLFVSGGGANLATAVSIASPGDIIEITDSLNYDAIVLMNPTDLTIRAAAGQTPSISAVPSGAFDHAVNIQGGFQGLRLKGLTFISDNNSGTHSTTDLGRTGCVFMSYLDGGSFSDRLIIEDCTFSEESTAANDGCPGLTLWGDGVTVSDNVWIHRCKFQNVGSTTAVGGLQWGAITIAGFDKVWIQNCLVVRQDAVLPTALSNMKGMSLCNANSVVEDVLCDQIGTNGNPQAFLTGGLPGIDIGFITSATFRNCVAYNCRIGFELNQAAGSLVAENCVYDAATVAPGGVVMRLSAGASYVAQDCVLTAQGGGITFSAAGITETFNDVFNFSATGKPLDASDLTVDPLYEDVPNRIFRATAAAVQTGGSDGGAMGVRYASGEEIFWVNTPQGT